MKEFAPHSPLPGQDQRPWTWASLALFALLAVVAFGTVFDYGVSWDEAYRFESGDRKLDYYQALFSGGDAQAAENDSYPGLFDLPLAWFHEQFPDWGSRYRKGHVFSLLFGLAGIFAGWRIAVTLGGQRAGFWCLLLMTATPRYYGHMFFNPKDTPFAALYLIALYFLIRLLQDLPNLRLSRFAWFGLAAGAAMSVRIGGLITLCFLALFIGLYLLWRAVEPAWRGRCGPGELWPLSPEFRSSALKALGGCALSASIALVWLLFWWPAAHANPFAHTAESLETVQQFGWNGYVLFGGDHVRAPDLPRTYLPTWILITMPEIIMALLLAGLILAGRALVADEGWRGSADPVKRLPMTALVFAFAFPVLYIVIKKPILYDGLRHSLFVLLPMSIAAGLAFEHGLRWLANHERWRQAVKPAIGVLGAAVALLWFELFSLHPYQYVYFNTLSGGLNGALGEYETDYWGLSHREAGEWLNAYLEETEGDNAESFKVLMVYNPVTYLPFMTPRLSLTQEPSEADFFVAITRLNAAAFAQGELLYVVERQGVPLCLVMDLRAGPAARTSSSEIQ